MKKAILAVIITVVIAAAAANLFAKTDGVAATPATTTPARTRNSRRFVSSLRNMATLSDDPNLL